MRGDTPGRVGEIQREVVIALPQGGLGGKDGKTSGALRYGWGSDFCVEGVREILRSVHPEVGEHLFFYELR